MSSWIESLKTYHAEKGSKFSIPKKDSTEYSEILKYHSSRKVPKTTAPVVPSTEEVVAVKPKRTYKKRAPKNIDIPESVV